MRLLTEILANDPHDANRVDALKALSIHLQATVVDQSIREQVSLHTTEFLMHTDPYIRSRAVEAAGLQKDPRYVEVLRDIQATDTQLLPKSARGRYQTVSDAAADAIEQIESAQTPSASNP